MRYFEYCAKCDEYVGPGVERVYAARFNGKAVPVLFICHPDGTYVVLHLSQRKRQSTTHNRAGDV